MMKNLFNASFIKGATISALFLMLFIGFGSMGETSAKNEKGSKFERQLLKKLDRLLELLSPSEEESTSGQEAGGSQLNAFNTFYNPDCLKDYKSLPYSGVYREDAPWDMMFTMGPGGNLPITESYMDLNGDGLLDYLYIHHGADFVAGPYSNGAYDYARYKDMCVYLNNGSGWDSTYRCKVTRGDKIPGYTNVYYPRFYGDCAQL